VGFNKELAPISTIMSEKRKKSHRSAELLSSHRFVHEYLTGKEGVDALQEGYLGEAS